MLPFPKMKIMKTSINSDMDWKSDPLRTSFDNSHNGHVYFYRDKTVAQKELTPQEIAAINIKESTERDAVKAALDGGDQNVISASRDTGLPTNGVGEAGSSSYTAAVAKNRRKERALKIYLDASPVKAS